MANFKTPKIRSPIHLAFVRSHACIVTGYKGNTVVAHHLLRAGGKGLGTKACDSLAVPLSSYVHDALHKNGNEVAFFVNHGLNYESVKEIARKLSFESPDKRIREIIKGEINV